MGLLNKLLKIFNKILNLIKIILIYKSKILKIFILNYH
jgi:hypothetical protein